MATELISKLTAIDEIAPVLLAQLQSGELPLTVAGEVKMLFENLAEIIKKGIKSKMTSENIEYESNENVEIKLQNSRKYDYTNNKSWSLLDEEIKMLKEAQKSIEKEIREVTGDAVTIEKRLVISKKK